MHNAVETATVIIEMLYTGMYLKGLFQNHERRLWQAAVAYITCGIGLLAVSFLKMPIVGITYEFIIVFFLARYLFKAQWASSLYSALLLCAIVVAVDMVCSGILVLFGVPADALYDMTNERILFIAIAKLTQIFCVILVVKLSQWRKSGESLLSAIPLLLCQVFSIFIGHSMYLGISEITRETTLSFLLATIGLLYINVIIFLYVERVKKIDEIKKNNALAEQLYKSKLDYFEQVKQDQEQTRALWHDIQKYMNTMQDLIRLGDPTDARECIGHVSELFENTGTIVDVGNTVVSAVLNHSVQKARRQNIDIEMDVRVPEALSVTAADLSVIIGNTFDNAIEAVTKVAEDTRSISLRLIQKNDLLLYEIVNPVPHTTVTKKRNAVQGYGLKNVRRCVDKYKGNLTIDSSGGMYKVTALIGVA